MFWFRGWPLAPMLSQTALMAAAKLGLCVPRPEPGEVGESKPKTPQMALREAMDIARKYAHPGGEVSCAGGDGVWHYNNACPVRK